MDIGGWLRNLGLAQYEAAFREHEIDAEVLPELAEADLEKLGMPLGHRKRLLKAIRVLGTGETTPPFRFSIGDDARGGAERRQLTVMFCDLVGSTVLSARMDPEDLREVIGAYQRCCAEVIARSGGFVAQYLGDGILAYFGHPQAHEEDAERAVSAGLALLNTVAKLDTSAGTRLRVRVGIAAGLVVVGDLIGEGTAQQQTAVGETPNLAARLQTLAEPDTVVISGSTRRLVGALFEYRALGSVSVKGLREKVPVWQVTGASAIDSRFEALRSTTTAMVGRAEEIDVLARRWQQAKDGEGCVVLISGEPGIGKSRLVQTILERLSGEPHTCLRYFCSPHHQDSAFYPIITQIERAAGFRREDTVGQRLDKLEAVLGPVTNDLSEAAPLLAALLSIQTRERYPPLNLSPQKQKQKTFQALSAYVERLAARRPVLMIVEDAHWIDPTSREWFDLLIDGVSSLWVLLIITFRPELTPSWTGRPQVTLLSLGRLPPRRCAEMITHMTGGKALPKEIADQIVDRTDGVPLFIEELTKAVIESGVLAETGDGYGATGAVLPLAIPTSLHASLLARLDRLASVREVAQIAAALGRQFSYLLISAVAPRPRQELDEALAQLVRAELIFQRGRVPDAEYAFKHVLVADAAYGTLLRSRRQQIHARIAKVLEEKFPERATVEPELLAHHLTEAAQVEAAISYWLKAGRRAAERSANEEAVRHLKRGLKLLTTLPESTQRDQLELEIQLALATPLVARHGFSSPIIGAARDRAIALCEKLGDRFRLLPCLYGKFAYCVTSGKIRMALEYAERCQSLAAETGDRLSRLITLRAKGSVLLEMGEFQAARVHLNQLLAHYSIEQDRTLAAQYVADPRASGLVFLALALWALGYPDQAIAAREQAFKHAADLNHANTSGFVYIYGGAQLSLLLGNMDDVRANLDKLVALVEERMPHWGALDQIMMGWALASAGPMDEAIALLQKGIDTIENMGGTFHYPHYISLLAILNARAGNMQDSLGSISKAKALIADSGEYFWHADVLRIEGELGLLFGQSAQKAEMCFVQALEVARKQHAKSFELRAATSLAGLWSRSG